MVNHIWGLKQLWVRIPLETYIFILNFSLPPRSEQVNGAVANEIKHVHSPEVKVVLDPRYDLSYKALYISTCSIALKMLALHIIRAPAEARSQDLPVPRRGLYHWATDPLDRQTKTPKTKNDHRKGIKRRIKLICHLLITTCREYVAISAAFINDGRHLGCLAVKLLTTSDYMLWSIKKGTCSSHLWWLSDYTACEGGGGGVWYQSLQSHTKTGNWSRSKLKISIIL